MVTKKVSMKTGFIGNRKTTKTLECQTLKEDFRTYALSESKTVWASIQVHTGGREQDYFK